MATTGKREKAELKKVFEGLLNRYVIDDGFEPISEQEFVDAAIRFANGADTGEPLWLLVLSVKNPKMQWKTQPGAIRILDTERQSFRAALAEIARGEPLSKPKDTMAAASRMLLVPRATLKGRELSVAYRYLPEDVSAALGYVLLLLVDQSKPYGRDLRQCQLEECQKFFFVQRPKTGRPRTAYCSEEHMQAKHQSEATERVRISRGRRKKGKKR